MTMTTADGIKADYMAQRRQKQMYSGLLLIIFVALLVSSFRLANDRNAGGFFDGLHRVLDFPTELLTEALQKITLLPANLARFLPALIETINIAAVSTLIGALLAMVLSLLSTRGLALWPRAIPLFRRMMDVMRAVPEVVIALVLIFILGGGPVPAMIAIAFHTAGALGKQFSEVNENADLKPVEGLASVGGSWFQRMWLGVVPQVAPNYLSYALMRFEINVRASAILGFVGAGGIGYELKIAIGWGQGRYDAAAAIFLLLFLTIVAIDQISSHYRNKLVKGH
ncbi:phosphonate ABC transporter, permease protein PhnE [Frigidibacter mobilis]|uniref:Phosphonate ABC transporter, permease protein n=1 Tax=Frigidibacter mobilis TaxID=1335048 RepID=A0A159Z3C8_9RHOB|nr:phosphonate ABC transporter, permease protein PhnE [Frigidibacter mobilis]AMY69657.1 phosphonate ABC transporter, permease protein [Frigidibacter mobilis]